MITRPGPAERPSPAIQGTGCRNRVPKIRRHVATTQEIRESYALEADGGADSFGIRARGKRSAASLPEYRDDIYRNDRRDRSWKRHRSVQWRAS